MRKADIAPGQPDVDPDIAAAEQRQRQRDGVEQRRLLHQMVVIVRLPLDVVLDDAVQLTPVLPPTPALHRQIPARRIAGKRAAYSQICMTSVQATSATTGAMMAAFM